MWFRMLPNTTGYRHLMLAGRLDVEGATEAEAVLNKLLAGENLPLLLDFADITFIASAGMRVLMKIAKELQQNNYRLMLLKPRPEVVRALDMSGFGQVLHYENDEQHAIGKILSGRESSHEGLGKRGFMA